MDPTGPAQSPSPETEQLLPHPQATVRQGASRRVPEAAGSSLQVSIWMKTTRRALAFQAGTERARQPLQEVRGHYLPHQKDKGDGRLHRLIPPPCWLNTNRGHLLGVMLCNRLQQQVGRPVVFKARFPTQQYEPRLGTS